MWGGDGNEENSEEQVGWTRKEAGQERSKKMLAKALAGDWIESFNEEQYISLQRRLGSKRGGGEGQDDWRFGVGGNVSMEREIFREVYEARDRGEFVHKV